eukprot:tig00000718_g3712.t1
MDRLSSSAMGAGQSGEECPRSCKSTWCGFLPPPEPAAGPSDILRSIDKASPGKPLPPRPERTPPPEIEMIERAVSDSAFSSSAPLDEVFLRMHADLIQNGLQRASSCPERYGITGRRRRQVDHAENVWLPMPRSSGNAGPADSYKFGGIRRSADGAAGVFPN